MSVFQISNLRAFARSDRATATLEFCIVFPIIMILFIAVFETALILIRQVMLERSLDNTVRLLRLTDNENIAVSDIRTYICGNTIVLPNCEDVLVIDLREIDQSNYALPGDDTLCVDRDGTINPANEFDTRRAAAGEDELMLIRVCAEVARILPFSGFGLNLTRDNNDNVHMTSASVFVNEPDI
ncbi:MAG: TadE/TadG family type IV pilus assembly protein [Pseudomonadota bacterium]